MSATQAPGAPSALRREIENVVGEAMRVGSLFAGIGGFDLAARWVGWRTAWVSEIEPYASQVLARHFPDAPNYGDITAMRGELLPAVDVLCGGFPCQDISLAGKGAGLAGARSGLWSHYARLIGELKPRWVVAENVAALRTRGLDTVLSDLASLGYDAEWHCIPASAVGAPHRRDRIWIIARPAGWFPDPICTDMGDTQRPRLEGHAGAEDDAEGWAVEAGSAPASGVRDGRDAAGWWATEPDVGRVAHGIPHRVDRLRCLGNAVVPQVPYYLFRQIIKAEAAKADELRHLLSA